VRTQAAHHHHHRQLYELHRCQLWGRRCLVAVGGDDGQGGGNPVDPGGLGQNSPGSELEGKNGKICIVTFRINGSLVRLMVLKVYACGPLI
jgi:hypothetical protein